MPAFFCAENLITLKILNLAPKAARYTLIC